jgi:hypothetical protein
MSAIEPSVAASVAATSAQMRGRTDVPEARRTDMEASGDVVVCESRESRHRAKALIICLSVSLTTGFFRNHEILE